MRTFKLLQWYPSLDPTILKIGDTVTRIDSDAFYTKGLYHIPYTEVETNPSFWQDVTPFRVVAVKSKTGLPSTRFNPDTNQVIWDIDSEPQWKDINEFLNSPDFDIYSVERFSDGEKFTIGDIVQHYSMDSDRGIITKILPSKYSDSFSIYYTGVHQGEMYNFHNTTDSVLHLKGTPIYIDGGHCLGTIDNGVLKISKYAL